MGITLENQLNESKMNLQKVIDKVNQLEQEKQQVLQEALRLDGEVRILTKMIKSNNTSGDIN